MQTTKILFVIGLAATLVVSARTVVARDTEEQIKAREALRQKLAELDGHPAPVASEPPQSPAKPAAPAPIPAAAVTVPSDSKYAPVPGAGEDVNASQLREALRQKMVALDNAPGSAAFAPVPEASEAANASQLREALRQQVATLDSASAVAPTPTKSGRAAAVTAPVVLAPPAMEVPLSPLTGSKAARLAELLKRYNADQITPKEYHTQRAAILAEP